MKNNKQIILFMKKTSLFLVAATLCITSGNAYAKVAHGSILKKDQTVTKIQGEAGPDAAGIQVDFRLVSAGGTTYAQIDGTGYALAANAWSAQIRYGAQEMQCPVANRVGNLCTWSFADPNSTDAVSAVVEDDNNFFQTPAYAYDKTQVNSPIDGDNAAPVISSVTATADDNSVTLILKASDNNTDFFYYVSSAANGLQTVSFGDTCMFTGLMSGTDYEFSVVAIDFSGNESTAQTVKATTTGDRPAFDASANLALNKLSSTSTGSAKEGNDGSMDTRWRSSNANEQDWWMVNLGADYVVNRVVIKMNGDGGAREATYNIEVSLTGEEGTWIKVVENATIPAGSGQELNEHMFDAKPARFVRYYGLTNGGWDHNFAEFEVYGTGYYDPSAGDELANVFVTPSDAVNYMGDELQLTVLATTGVGTAIKGATFTWSIDPAVGATVTETGVFTATQTGTYTVTATTTVDGITKSGSASIEVKEARRPATVNLTRKMENNINSNWSDVFLTGEAVPYTLDVRDQYNNVMTDYELQYETDGGSFDEAAGTVTWAEAGEKTFTVTAGDAVGSFTVQVLKAKAITEGLTAEASSTTDNPEMTADKAVDNNLGTRWTSKGTTEGVAQDEVLTIDMGTTYNLVAVSTIWEGACAAEFEIAVSADGNDYTSLGGETRANGIVNHTYRVKADATQAVRYIKVVCKVPATAYGYSLFEVIPYVEDTTGPSTGFVATAQSGVSVVSTMIQDGQLRLTGEAATVSVYSLQGQLVLSQQNIRNLSLANIPQGLYVVKLIDLTGKQSTVKVEVQ